jgi:hypothetical protein
MANRTIQIWGQGYGSTPCTANVTFGGDIVFSGPIPTVDSTIVARLPDEQTMLINFEVPIELSGTFPVTIEFVGTDAFISAVLANYSVQNDSETFFPVALPQYKTNVNINGIAVAPPDPLPSGVTGEWGWEIPCINDGVGTISFDLIITAGVE